MDDGKSRFARVRVKAVSKSATEAIAIFVK